jgi:hypothetical protein
MFRSMKRISRVFALLIVFVVVAVAWTPAKRFLLQDACLDAGGKWASNGDYCIYRDCASNGSCKPSYGNNIVCESLKPGISKEELFFHLGMPESVNGSVYVFTGGGAEPRIKAIIEEGQVRELQCRT